MTEVLEGLPASFTKDINEELTKPFFALKFFEAIEGMADGKALGRHLN